MNIREMNIRERLRPSLFRKLFFIFMILAVLLIVTFAASFQLLGGRSYKKAFRSNIVKYSILLKNELGLHPTPEKIKRLSKELDLKIGYFGPFKTILSDKRVPNPRSLRFTHRISTFPNVNFYHDKTKQFVFIQDGARSYLFGVSNDLFDADFIYPLFVSLSISLFLLILAYSFVNRLFRPLVYIKEGAENYARGNFDYKIPTTGTGPLADLSRSVRIMSENIQNMLDSKRELLLSIAHELKTPLTRARLHLELIEDEKGKKEIIEEINEMNFLVTDILESERLKSGHAVLVLSQVKMPEFLQNLVTQYFKNHDVKVKIEDQKVLQVDEMKYTLLVKNLLSNAIRYSQSHDVKITLTKDYLCVEDHGKGMSEDDVSKVTDAFYRVDKSRGRKTGGVGLGLYLAVQIAKAHGQELKIESQINKGTKVFVYF